MAGTSSDSPPTAATLSRYESQKRRDWNTFGQYLKNHRPPLALARCSGAHVLEFLRYLDQFGKTKVHVSSCPFFGQPNPPAPCPCPLRQAWGSLDALIGRLRAAFDEHGGQPEANPFAARAVRLYLRDVRDSQAKARGIAYEKKKRKRPQQQQQQQQLPQPQQQEQLPQQQPQPVHHDDVRQPPASVSVPAPVIHSLQYGYLYPYYPQELLLRGQPVVAPGEEEAGEMPLFGNYG